MAVNEPTKSIKKIALERCDELIEHYRDLKARSRKRSEFAQGITLVLTAITPVLLLLPLGDESRVKIFAAFTSTGAAISTGLLSIYGWKETYIRIGYIYHAIESEKHLYLTRASTDYANSDEDKAAQEFAKRIEKFYMTEASDWRSEMQRNDPQSPQNMDPKGPG